MGQLLDLLAHLGQGQRTGFGGTGTPTKRLTAPLPAPPAAVGGPAERQPSAEPPPTQPGSRLGGSGLLEEGFHEREFFLASLPWSC